MNLSAYNPTIEERIRNVVRVEEPATLREIARFIRDVRIGDLHEVVWEMVRDGQLRREWTSDIFADFKFRL